MTKWWMSTELLPLSNDVHLMAITNIKGLRLSGHNWAINPPAQVQRKAARLDIYSDRKSVV